MSNTIYLTGLPRSGSTLLCNLLNLHSDIKVSTSSPLCHLIQNLRATWSDDSFLLSQLDNNYEEVYDRLKRSIKSFIETWTYAEDKSMFIDKNRGWVHQAEFLRHIYPNFKMIVTLRDLRNVYASIEKRHRKTLLIDFPDHMEHNNVDKRADALFKDEGIIGSCLKGLENLGDVPDIMPHIFLWKYEDFIKDPQENMDLLFKWLNVSSHKYDFDNIKQTLFESDSHYRFKYLHKINSKVQKPLDFTEAKISPRMLNTITQRFTWYYNMFYPELNINNSQNVSSNNQIINKEDEKIAQEIEEALNDSE